MATIRLISTNASEDNGGVTKTFQITQGLSVEFVIKSVVNSSAPAAASAVVLVISQRVCLIDLLRIFILII